MNNKGLQQLTKMLRVHRERTPDLRNGSSRNKGQAGAGGTLYLKGDLLGVQRSFASQMKMNASVKVDWER